MSKPLVLFTVAAIYVASLTSCSSTGWVTAKSLDRQEKKEQRTNEYGSHRDPSAHIMNQTENHEVSGAYLDSIAEEIRTHLDSISIDFFRREKAAAKTLGVGTMDVINIPERLGSGKMYFTTKEGAEYLTAGAGLLFGYHKIELEMDQVKIIGEADSQELTQEIYLAASAADINLDNAITVEEAEDFCKLAVLLYLKENYDFPNHEQKN